MKFAASTTILATVSYLVISAMMPTKAIAFDDIARATLEVDNVSFTLNFEYEENFESKYESSNTSAEWTYEVITLLSGDDKFRIKFQDGKTSVHDLNPNQGLKASSFSALIDPDESDVLSEFIDTRHFMNPFFYIQSQLNHVNNSETQLRVKLEKLSDEAFNGQPAIGYRIIDRSDEEKIKKTDIWADAETGLPIYIESIVSKDGHTLFRHKVDNFKYNQDFGPDQISLDIFLGFKIKTEINTSVQTPIEWGKEICEEIIKGFRDYFNYVGGPFPETINAYRLIADTNMAFLEKNPDVKVPWGEVSNQIVEGHEDYHLWKAASGGATSIWSKKFALEITDGMEHHYVGAGVELGDKDSPVFWITHEDTDQHIVIYGDLSLKQVDEPPVKP